MLRLCKVQVSACHYKTNPVFAGHFASSRTISAPEAVNMDIVPLKLAEDSFTGLPQNFRGGSKCGTTGGPINMKSQKQGVLAELLYWAQLLVLHTCGKNILIGKRKP
ncbi:uncharacterized protein LOC131324728 [Rhododendron vialii]|uniref:uncharacterized protein LOC131324728 n=1 Tax=Rhododendron vialii TaxID=182163 RepID=UPI00265F8AAE|nr:uncharacterized protein LOC131324728 [Rhododendron vialii]